jgi:hypothetical protein
MEARDRCDPVLSLDALSGFRNNFKKLAFICLSKVPMADESGEHNSPLTLLIRWLHLDPDGLLRNGSFSETRKSD